MGITINRKTKGRVTLTKPIAKILNEWKLDFDSSASQFSGELKVKAIQERDFIDKILTSKELNILDVEHLNDLVETNINNYSPPDFLVNQIDLIYGFKSFANAGDAIANEAKVVKKFINKHFTFSFHP